MVEQFITLAIVLLIRQPKRQQLCRTVRSLISNCVHGRLFAAYIDVSLQHAIFCRAIAKFLANFRDCSSNASRRATTTERRVLSSPKK